MESEIKNSLREIKQVIDAEIEEILKNKNELIEGLFKSAAYSVSGGKRLRAVFAILVGRIFDISLEKMIKPAVALELIHAASLIMDDLPYMDDSQLRRGKPANHIIFGQDVALLASVALISEANQIVLSDENLTVSERNQVTAMLCGSYGFNGLAAGQFVDLKLKRKDIEFKIFKFINEKKTAALFTASGLIAATIGHAKEKEKKALQAFSENIGFAFQIMDDLLDISGDEKIVGKNLNHDKTNFIQLVGIDAAKNYLKKYHEKAEAALNIFGKKAHELKGFSSYLFKRIY
jgi:geranylgeranyl diphosphate synthase type II